MRVVVPGPGKRDQHVHSKIKLGRYGFVALRRRAFRYAWHTLQSLTQIRMKLYSKIEGSGKPLVILHGFLGMSDNWKTLSGKYAEAGYEVHALDLRNHGRSFHDPVFTYPAMIEDLERYCEAQQLKQIYLMGHSMGGKLAMMFALQNPDMVSRLIVADIAPRSYKPHHDEILDGLAAIDFSEKPDRSEVDSLLSAYIPDMGTRQFLMKSLYWKEQGQLAWRFNLEAFRNNREMVGQGLTADAVFSKPVLFLKGETSNYIQEKDHEQIHQHFPQATIEVIKDAGHWLHAENPKQYLDVSLKFLQQE
jgi:esterase